MFAVAVRDRLRLLARVKAAGPWVLAGVVAVNLVGSLLPAATAVALALLIGRVTAAGAASVAAVAVAPLAMFAAVLLLGHALDAVREPLYFLAGARIDGAHRAEVARLAATGQLGALERSEVQQLIREAKADPDNWSERTPSAGALAQLGLVGRGFGLVASAGLLAGYAWWLVLLIVVPAIVYQQLNRHRAVVGMRHWRLGLGEGLRAQVWWEAIYSPGEGKELRVFGLGEWAVERVNRHTAARFAPAWRHGAGHLGQMWQQFLLVLLPLGVGYVLVTVAAARGEASVEIATAVLAAGWSIYQLFGGDPNNVIGGIAGVSALDRLRAALEDPAARAVVGPAAAQAAAAHPVEDPARHTDRGLTPDTRNGAQAPPLVRFDNVGFTYPGGHRAILDRLDLEIRPGEMLAVVGLNGAGKSTLIKLLAGLYGPSCGRITADGVEIGRLPASRWRDRTAFVFQDFVRYHLSAADNVALGRAGVPRDQAAIEAAARDAGLEEVVADLPHGWETPLARSRTNGVDLSGGQWQQVVLARALYAVRTGARLLVLDEPTAHLDVRTEFDVFARLAAHKGDASVVLISHRLSTVRQADRIVLLQEGRITESGSHDELMARGGTYAEMFAIQADRFNRGYDDRIEEGELL